MKILVLWSFWVLLRLSRLCPNDAIGSSWFAPNAVCRLAGPLPIFQGCGIMYDNVSILNWKHFILFPMWQWNSDSNFKFCVFCRFDQYSAVRYFVLQLFTAWDWGKHRSFWWHALLFGNCWGMSLGCFMLILWWNNLLQWCPMLADCCLQTTAMFVLQTEETFFSRWKVFQTNSAKKIVTSNLLGNDLLPVAPISGGYDTVAQIVQTYTLVALWLREIWIWKFRWSNMWLSYIYFTSMLIRHVEFYRLIRDADLTWCLNTFLEVSWTHQLFQNKLDRTKTPMPKCWILSSLQIWASLMFTGKRHASFKHLSSPFHVWYALAETTKLMFCWSMQSRELTFKMNISSNRYETRIFRREGQSPLKLFKKHYLFIATLGVKPGLSWHSGLRSCQAR